MSHFRKSLVAAALSASVAAQVTLPPAAVQWAGNLHHHAVFYRGPGGSNEARTQLLYDLADIPATLSVIQQIAFRPLGISNGAATIDVDIRISTSPRDPNSPSSTFLLNAPGPATPAFSGTISLPAVGSGSWPRPWAVSIPLQTPYLLAPAPGDLSLVIDVQCANSTGSMSWYVEEYSTVQTVAGQGVPILTQPSCLLPNGQPQLQSSFQPGLLHPGGRIALTLGLYPSNQPSAAVNALVIGLDAQGGMIGNATLPVSLASFGIPTPPNCLWSVVPAMSVPIAYGSYSWGGNLSTNQLVPLPNIPGLAGLRLYAQNAALLQYSSGLQVFPSVAMEFIIGDSATPSGSTVVATGNRFATQGTIGTGGPVSIQLQ